MKSLAVRRWVVIVLAVAMLGSSGLALWAQSAGTPATAPAAQPAQPGEPAPGVAAGQADPREIMMEIQQAAMEMQQALGTPDVVIDPAKRDAAAPQVIPPLKRMIASAKKLEGVHPDLEPQARQMQMQFHVMAATFGDTDSRAVIEASAKSDDPAEASTGQAAVLLVDWFRSNQDAATQTRILDRAEALAQTNARSNEVSEILLAMAQVGAANDELEKRAEKIATAMDTDVARQVRERSASREKLEAVEGQPITIAGTTVGGKPFSTEQWKGKVVLVDFWATWCGPCIAELPRLKKVYADYHDKGLEVLGVSNDYNPQALSIFVEKNPDMPWPQLLDLEAAQRGDWHPITVNFGIDAIPTMFLIDKKGVVRSVNARENFEELIPRLLEE
jgi:thiol-disulfide isomerase/thioredoxin